MEDGTRIAAVDACTKYNGLIKGEVAEDLLERARRSYEMAMMFFKKVFSFNGGQGMDWRERISADYDFEEQAASFARLRSMVREMLADELGQIDELVEPMLRAGAP
jgi:hypothetical protein